MGEEERRLFVHYPSRGARNNITNETASSFIFPLSFPFVPKKTQLTVHVLLRLHAQCGAIPHVLSQLVAGANVSKLRKVVEYLAGYRALAATGLPKDE